MANSAIISEFKELIVDEMLHNQDLYYAIDPIDCENGGDLLNTHIFKYNFNPDVVTDEITFITVVVDTRKKETRYGKNISTFIIPVLGIWIYSHYNHMKMDPRITKDNRNDYISILLDTMINGADKFGTIGRLDLTANQEGIFNRHFLYRHMTFEALDLNNSVCDVVDSGKLVI